MVGSGLPCSFLSTCAETAMPASAQGSHPTPEEVREIANLSDPVHRNHRITLGYHRLARSLAERLGSGAEGNWCAFATWASRQAGRTIRGEDLRRGLEAALGNSPELLRALQATVSAARPLGSKKTVGELRSELFRLLDVDGAVQRTAAAVARGNRIVFEDVGLAVSRFLQKPPGDLVEPEAPAQGDEFRWPWLREGDPPEGQRYLRSALDRLRELESEGEAKRRAELLFLANVEVGYHEQVRVDPEIRAALDAPIPDPIALRDRILSFLFSGAGLWLQFRVRFWSRLRRRSPLDQALNRLVEALRAPLRQALTAHMLALELPGERPLRLGVDLGGPFPDMLAQLEHPELLALLEKIDPTPDSLEGTGARDWAILDDRVHFIVDLFRRHQASSGLLTAPYTPSEVAAIDAGRLSEHYD
jgi:hypothetical protein